MSFNWMNLMFTLWVRCSWELMSAEVIVGAMLGSVCRWGLCRRENLVSAASIPPIYTPSSPFECVGLGLPGVSHSLVQSERGPRDNKGCKTLNGIIAFKDNGLDLRGTTGVVGGRGGGGAQSSVGIWESGDLGVCVDPLPVAGIKDLSLSLHCTHSDWQL